MQNKSRWRDCRSKNRYKTEGQAIKYCTLYSRERGQKLDYYFCGHCNGFHLTSKLDTNWIRREE